MGREIFEPLVTIAAGVIGVAIIAVLVSNKAQTGNVLASAGGAFSNVLSAATAPVTGSAATPNVNAGATSGGGLASGLSLPNLMSGGNVVNF
jgi:hypothetical protein